MRHHRDDIHRSARKDDTADARAITHLAYLTRDNLTDLGDVATTGYQLRAWLAIARQARKDATRSTNRLRQALQISWPEAEPHTEAALGILSHYPTRADVAAASNAELRQHASAVTANRLKRLANADTIGLETISAGELVASLATDAAQKHELADRASALAAALASQSPDWPYLTSCPYISANELAQVVATAGQTRNHTESSWRRALGLSRCG